MIHALKILPEYFRAVTSGKKTFEARRDDRGFRAGDYLALNEWEADAGEYTGRCCLVRVTDILADEEYCKPGFAIMAFEPCSISSGTIPLLGGLQASAPAVYAREEDAGCTKP